MVAVVDQVLGRLPFVRLLYTSTKDLLNAFVGEKRRFDKPVLVRMSAHDRRAHGRLRDAGIARPTGLPGYSSVYFPQSYNFAGNLVVFPSTALRAARCRERGRHGVHRLGRRDRRSRSARAVHNAAHITRYCRTRRVGSRQPRSRHAACHMWRA